MMQRPILVAPGGGSAVTVPLAEDSADLLAWINAHPFTTVSEATTAQEAAAAAAAAAAPPPPVDNFYASMSQDPAADPAAEDDDDDDFIPGSVDDAADALRSMVLQMPENELRSAAELMELGDLEGLDRDSLSTEDLREIVVAAIDGAVAR